jgi:hypothetical protein
MTSNAYQVTAILIKTYVNSYKIVHLMVVNVYLIPIVTHNIVILLTYVNHRAPAHNKGANIAMNAIVVTIMNAFHKLAM